ncbi:hypothetical protein AAF712_015694 [Marasmius tenuissimus]|uniref:Uncharacterized protein n=1 Tax=Marasmius tenuissimus TaxID=585030 RepID=A0ABR2Z8P3_9AGAR
MSEPSSSATTQGTETSETRGRGRGRGKSRGGLGKYLRARGRGRGFGRPAEFHKRLLLEGEGPADEEEDEGEKAERAKKYSRRQLGTNADRYKEEEPELGSDGEPIVEPEVDLSSFLARQKLDDEANLPGPSVKDDEDDDDDVDHSIDPVALGYQSKSDIAASRKGKAQEIQWDNQLDELMREKESADAARDLKSRFRAKSEKLKTKPITPSVRERKQDGSTVEAPPLPLPENAKLKTQQKEMEDFLDDLLG